VSREAVVTIPVEYVCAACFVAGFVLGFLFIPFQITYAWLESRKK
jgi:hypothetical protein